MTGKDLVRQRLVSQRIWGMPFSTPVQVVHHLGAAQAQDYRGGLWAVGLRARGVRESTVEQALADRTIVRTWPLRGTLHLVAADDVRWMLALLAPRVLARAARRYRELELAPTVFTRCRKLFEKALRGGGRRTRDERRCIDMEHTWERPPFCDSRFSRALSEAAANSILPSRLRG
ncbi:MAG: DNA glycosylase AlkZ-like family protein [Spirochaetia bacterium]